MKIFGYSQTSWETLDRQVELSGQGLPIWQIPCMGLIYHMCEKIKHTQDVPLHTITKLDIQCVELADFLQVNDKKSQ